MVFHPIEDDLSSFDIRRESTVFLDYIEDGSFVVVYRLSGEHQKVDEALEGHPMVREHEVFDIHNDTFHIYVWCEPGEPIATILRSANERGILLKTPYSFDEDENLEVTTVGKGDNVIDSLSDIYEVIDEDVEFIMEKTSEYQPQLDEDDYESLLTERQREVLEVAIEKGYYSVPRETSYEEIGEEAGVSAVTVGQILRRAKARLIRNLF